MVGIRYLGYYPVDAALRRYLMSDVKPCSMCRGMNPDCPGVFTVLLLGQLQVSFCEPKLAEYHERRAKLAEIAKLSEDLGL
jgi:hypothetical protein